MTIKWLTSVIILSRNIRLSYLNSVHFSIVPFPTSTSHFIIIDSLVIDNGALHEKLVGGARNTIESWCQATGNLTRETATAITICHGPIEPMASWTVSNGTRPENTYKIWYKIKNIDCTKNKCTYICYKIIQIQEFYSTSKIMLHNLRNTYTYTHYYLRMRMTQPKIPYVCFDFEDGGIDLILISRVCDRANGA